MFIGKKLFINMYVY